MENLHFATASVFLTCSSSVSYTHLISDTGPGVPPEQLPHVFERGYIAGDKSGTGMGLYIVKTVMEGMGGFVQVQNAYSGGLCFTLSFPGAGREEF